MGGNASLELFPSSNSFDLILESFPKKYENKETNVLMGTSVYITLEQPSTMF